MVESKKLMQGIEESESKKVLSFVKSCEKIEKKVGNNTHHGGLHV